MGLNDTASQLITSRCLPAYGNRVATGFRTMPAALSHESFFFLQAPSTQARAPLLPSQQVGAELLNEDQSCCASRRWMLLRRWLGYQVKRTARHQGYLLLVQAQEDKLMDAPGTRCSLVVRALLRCGASATIAELHAQVFSQIAALRAQRTYV